MRIAVTQRAVTVPSRNERRDTLDQAWIPFLISCGIEPIILSNKLPDPVSYMQRTSACGLIITGGGNISKFLGTIEGRQAKVVECNTDLAPERDQLETLLLHASITEDWPVLGVCRGMQVLNLFHGGTIVKLEGHAGTEHTLYPKQSINEIIEYKFDGNVNSFHDYGIREKDLGKNLRILAGINGYAEAIIHVNFRHLGLMWHPERNRPYSANDINIFKKFFNS